MAKAKMGPQMKGTADAITMALDQTVKKILESMGLATREDIAGLEKRVVKLEIRAAKAPAKKKAAARKPAKKAAAKKRAKKS
ncbi:MAG TPA: hypothetical protein VIK22_03360 [Candidatus Anoxymicrobiaceae bacterium]